MKQLSEIFKRKKKSIPMALGSVSGLSIPSPTVHEMVSVLCG